MNTQRLTLIPSISFIFNYMTCNILTIYMLNDISNGKVTCEVHSHIS